MNTQPIDWTDVLAETLGLVRDVAVWMTGGTILGGVGLSIGLLHLCYVASRVCQLLFATPDDDGWTETDEARPTRRSRARSGACAESQAYGRRVLSPSYRGWRG